MWFLYLLTLILEFYLLIGSICEVGWANHLGILKNRVRSRFAVIITWYWGNFYWFLLSLIVSKCELIIFELFHTWFFLDSEYSNFLFLILNRSYPFREIMRYILPTEFLINWPSQYQFNYQFARNCWHPYWLIW